MMTSWIKGLAGEAALAALRLRARLGLPRTESICPVDVAERLGLEVRFVDLPSMEGIYVNSAVPAILVSSLRPSGRRHFTCAHELGHHVFGHGARFDALQSKSGQEHFDADEFVADSFANTLLMPRPAIEMGLRRRGIAYSSITPIQLFQVASWLGVGYTTLISQLEFGLGLITARQAKELRKTTPRQIRQKLLDNVYAAGLHVVDRNWIGRPVDCELGDFLLVPSTTSVEGSALEREGQSRLKVVAPGLARLVDGEWSVFVRCSPAAYVGRAKYRFEETVE